MNFFDDIALMVDDFGVPVSSGGRTTKGILDMPDEDVGVGEGPSTFVGGMISVLYRTADLSLTIGGPVTVDQVRYMVRDLRKLDDGMICRAYCTKVK